MKELTPQARYSRRRYRAEKEKELEICELALAFEKTEHGRTDIEKYIVSLLEKRAETLTKSVRRIK